MGKSKYADAVIASCRDFKEEAIKLVAFYLTEELLDSDCVISVLDEVKATIVTSDSMASYISSLEWRDEE